MINKINKMNKIRTHHHINILLIINVLLIIIIIFLIKPALTGYKITKEFKEINLTPSDILKEIEKIRSDLRVSETNLKSCLDLKSDLMKELNDEKNKTFLCIQEKEQQKLFYESLIKEYQFNITQMINNYTTVIESLEKTINDEKEKYNNLLEGYEKIVQNSARTICCKEKVDDPSIDSYIISNNKIVCTIGAENKIKC